MSYSSEVLVDTPAVFYRCQEASGLIQDSSGHSLNANTSAGTPTYGQTSPITSDTSAKSILFANAQNFQVPDNATLDVGDVFTCESWYKRTATGRVTGESFCDRGTAAFKFFIEGSQTPGATDKIILTKPGTGDILVSSVLINNTNWHHLVVTKNGATIKLYIDTVEDTSATITNQTCSVTATALFIGSSRNSDDFANGNLTEVAIYPTALTAARVLAHYNARLTDPTWGVPRESPARHFGPF